MNLAHKTNKEIETEITRIVNSEFSLVIEGILYFCELVKRNLHLAGRHSSLFTYLVDKGFSRDQALVRKDAVLLLLELPELKSDFVRRHLSMSALHHMRQVFRREQRRRKKAKLEPLTRERKLEVARLVSRASSRDTRERWPKNFPNAMEAEKARAQWRAIRPRSCFAVAKKNLKCLKSSKISGDTKTMSAPGRCSLPIWDMRRSRSISQRWKSP